MVGAHRGIETNLQSYHNIGSLPKKYSCLEAPFECTKVVSHRKFNLKDLFTIEG